MAFIVTTAVLYMYDANNLLVHFLLRGYYVAPSVHLKDNNHCSHLLNFAHKENTSNYKMLQLVNLHNNDMMCATLL